MNSKILTVAIAPCNATKNFNSQEIEDGKTCKDASDYFEGKQIALLINSKKIDYGDDWETPQVHQYTDMHWLPITKRTPLTATVTLIRNRFSPAETLLETFLPYKGGDGF